MEQNNDNLPPAPVLAMSRLILSKLDNDQSLNGILMKKYWQPIIDAYDNLDKYYKEMQYGPKSGLKAFINRKKFKFYARKLRDARNPKIQSLIKDFAMLAEEQKKDKISVFLSMATMMVNELQYSEAQKIFDLKADMPLKSALLAIRISS